MSKHFVTLPPARANEFRATCEASGVRAQVLYPTTPGAHDVRVYAMGVSDDDFAALIDLDEAAHGTQILL